MKHIRPLAKADMEWFDDPWTIIRQFLKQMADILASFRPVFEDLGLKGETES